MDERTPSEEPDEEPLLRGMDEDLRDLGLGENERDVAQQAVLAGVEIGFLPPTWRVVSELGCLRTAIVIAWTGAGCLVSFVFVLVGWAVVWALGAAGSDLEGAVMRIASFAALTAFLITALFGSVATIRRVRPWKRR